jgi:hypothetical protein
MPSQTLPIAMVSDFPGQEQNRAAQKAFRERRENKVKDVRPAGGPG